MKGKQMSERAVDRGKRPYNAKDLDPIRSKPAKLDWRGQPEEAAGANEIALALRGAALSIALRGSPRKLGQKIRQWR
ncbi:hypothetical protein DSM21852_37090 [Methylocystis bryophila]|nr:hypothetical protein DSM21852_37090 [Methylocystis bryophila]